MPAPNERNDEVERQLRSLNRRVECLEDTQVTGRELNRGFDRVYEEIDRLENKVDHLQSDFEHLQSDFEHLQSDFDNFRHEINPKLDTILRHLTGMN